eukprot:11311-Heterococcus_DN1.PRE.3
MSLCALLSLPLTANKTPAPTTATPGTTGKPTTAKPWWTAAPTTAKPAGQADGKSNQLYCQASACSSLA